MRLNTLIGFILTLSLMWSGCSKPAPKMTKTKPALAGEADRSGQQVGERGDETDPVGTDGAPHPLRSGLLEKDPRAKAMDDALAALKSGSESAPRQVIDLGADTREVVRQAIESENILATQGALAVLQELGEKDKEAVELIRVALDNSSAAVRMDALDVIAALKATQMANDVVRRLKDEEVTVRATACDSLGALGVKEAKTLKRLFAMLSSDDDVIRTACAGAFTQLASATGWQEPVANLLNSKKPAAREGALRVLGHWRHEAAAFDLIRGRLSDEDGNVVALALAQLAPIGDDATLKEVQRFLGNERVAVRLEAVAGLVHLPAADVRRHVYDALRDREAAIRVEATTILTRFADDPETTIRLHALLRDESEAVRSAAVLALAELALPSSHTALLERLKDEPQGGIRADIVTAMVQVDATRSIPHLIDRLGVAEGEEQTAVIVSLRENTGQDLPMEKAAWQKWYASAQAAKKGAGSDPQ